MHLTNYSVNKHNEYYDRGAALDSGSKRSIKAFNDYLRRNDYDVSLLWKNISEMLVKTLLVAEPHIQHAYRMCRPGASPSQDSVCFEILGFDVLIDRKLRPWLLEVSVLDCYSQHFFCHDEMVSILPGYFKRNY